MWFRAEAPMRSATLWALLISISIGAATAQQARILQLPPHGSPDGHSKNRSWHFAGGTVLTDTIFYRSDSGDVTVGRTYLNGPVMPWATADYTDVFLVVHGSGTVLSRRGKTIALQAGDFVLLPRGATFEERNALQHIHFYASFEHQEGVSPAPPIALQQLHPRGLDRREFVSKGGFLRHTYYQGRGGVLVEVVRYPDRLVDPGFRKALESRLIFVVSGSGVIWDDQGTRIRIAPRTAILIPKEARFRRSVRNLYVLTVAFDRPLSK